MNQNFTEFEENGFVILKQILNEKNINDLLEELSKLSPSNSAGRKKQSVYGVRNLLGLLPKIKDFSGSELIREITEEFLNKNAKVVRAIFFDKTRDANWKVPWHQDLTISVMERKEAQGFSAWTRKSGINHVQPPLEILEKMITLRFHLDDADEENGALKVIPKSHKKGRLSAEEIKSLRQANEIRLCNVKKGDCLIMRPLILHSSSAGVAPKNRRVIHFEFSAENLPDGLNWYGS